MFIDFEVLFEEGTFTGEAEVQVSFDPQHGADADGNRGEPMWFIDSVNVVSCFNEYGKVINEFEIPGLYKAIVDKLEGDDRLFEGDGEVGVDEF